MNLPRPNVPLGGINPVMNSKYITQPLVFPTPQFMNQMSMGMGMPMGMPLLMNMQNPVPQATEYKKVWVGHIPPHLSDTFLQKLLETCGPVVSWKRTTDQTGKPQKFGICEYHSVESMLKCLRLLNHLKLEEGYELSIKVDTKTEDFLKQWREQKKNEWIEGLIRKGVNVNKDEIRKKENLGEPLEWELQLINKDIDTRKAIFEILTQKNEIEMYAKQNERPEEFLKDLKELTHGSLAQHFEHERERERFKRKQANLKKNDKLYKEEERKWEKHEEERERERNREKQALEDLPRRKNKLMHNDLNYDTDEERKRIQQNPKKYEEYKQMRLKEKELDDLMRQKDNPKSHSNVNVNLDIDEGITDLVPLSTDLVLNDEPKAKTMVIVRDYEEDEDNSGVDNSNSIPNGINYELGLNVKKPKRKLEEDSDEDINDPYSKKEPAIIEINPETEREIMEMSKDLKFVPEEREKKDRTLKNKANITEENIHVLKEIQKKILESIPKNKEDILKYPINWRLVEEHNIKNTKIRPWVSKKLKEYFGVELESFNKLLLDKIGTSPPNEILDTLSKVLEDDAEEFMCNMWKNLIFEVLKVEKMQKV